MSIIQNKNRKIFVGDIGIVLRVYAGQDLSNASSIVFEVKDPNGQERSWTASIASDNNYYAEYTTVSGDLDTAGDWILSLVAYYNTNKFSGASAYFVVDNQFEDI
jgi:hypothetical protein